MTVMEKIELDENLPVTVKVEGYDVQGNRKIYFEVYDSLKKTQMKEAVQFVYDKYFTGKRLDIVRVEVTQHISGYSKIYYGKRR